MIVNGSVVDSTYGGISVIRSAGELSDPVLQSLVATMNHWGELAHADPTHHSEVSTGITVTVGGAFISGDLVCPSVWFQALGEATARSRHNDFTSAFGILGTWAAGEQAADEDESTPEHLHLKNAQFWSGGLRQPTMPALWRGRLDQVQGWTLGTVPSS